MTPETYVKRSICSYLSLKRITFWVNDSVGIWNEKRGVFMQRRDPYRRKGVADILGCLPGGRLLAIEVKSSTGRLSPEQRAFLDEIAGLGGLAFMARSIDDVKRVLETAA